MDKRSVDPNVANTRLEKNDATDKPRFSGLFGHLRQAIHDPAILRVWMTDINDGIIATAGTLEGFARSGASSRSVLVAAIIATLAGGVALGGARWTEVAAEREAQQHLIEQERSGLERSPDVERAELVEAYVERGLTPELANQVAGQLMRHDAIAAQLAVTHGISQVITLSGAIWQSIDAILAFCFGAALPLLINSAVPVRFDTLAILAVVAVSLTITAIIAAKNNHASVLRTVLRTVSIGVISVAVSFIVGTLIGM